MARTFCGAALALVALLAVPVRSADVCKVCQTKEVGAGDQETYCGAVVEAGYPVFLDRVEIHPTAGFFCRGDHGLHLTFKEGVEHDMEMLDGAWESVELQHDNLQYNAGEPLNFKIENKNLFCGATIDVRVCYSEEHEFESAECEVEYIQDGIDHYICEEIVRPNNTQLMEVLVYNIMPGALCDGANMEFDFKAFPQKYVYKDDKPEKKWHTIDLSQKNVKYAAHTPMQFTARNLNLVCDVETRIRLHYKVDPKPDQRETFDGFYEPGGDAEVTDKECGDVVFKTGDCNCGMTISGAHMQIEDCTAHGGAGKEWIVSSGSGGIKTSWHPAHCRMDFNGPATMAQYMEVLAAARFHSEADPAHDREERCVSWQLGHGEQFADTKHYYKHYDIEVINHRYGRGHLWRDAQYFCAHKDQDVFGLVGYLATITSSAEESWLRGHIDGEGWLGASDMGTKNVWRWITGPEGCGGDPASTNPLRRSMCDVGNLDGSDPDCTGSQCNQGQAFTKNKEGGFWRGYKDYAEDLPGAFTHWEKDPEQPDNCCGWATEDFLHNHNDFTWNDEDNDHRVEGFTCEWGGIGTPCISDDEMHGKVCLVNVLDECTYEGACDHCAGFGDQNKCTQFDQTCTDPNHSGQSFSDWFCECKAPAVGKQVAGTATCIVDECTNCDGCGGHACVMAGQNCTDEFQDALQRDDYVCTCLEGNGQKTGGVADCILNECTHGAGLTDCVDGQECRDPDTSPAKTGDYVCTCPAPEQGNKTGGKANCTIDECVDGDGAKCIAAGQECDDPNPAAEQRGDFVCTCKLPPMDTNTGAVAVCMFDECALGEGKTLCVDEGQNCMDPNHLPEKLGDFTCTCKTPLTGTATGGQAGCELNECQDGIPGGLKEKCGADQLCVDPTFAVPAGDGYCQCKAPADSKTKVGDAVADCSWDECATHDGECHGAAQNCFDPDHAKAGDWECRCRDPMVPVDLTAPHGLQQVAQCKDPPGDCAVHGDICHAEGQDCDAGPTKDDVYTCKCIAPSVGSDKEKGPADCVLNECTTTCTSCMRTDDASAPTCGEQDCEDPDTSPKVVHDWKCVCKSPYTGSEVGKPVSVCAINECVQTCDHCEKGVCGSQDCNDPDDNIPSDWECVCPTPQTGSEVGKQATCTLDECSTNEGTCLAKWQTCEDRFQSPESTGDWECVCQAPSTSRNKAAVVDVCSTNECDDPTKNTQCTDVGQTCKDADEQTLNTWECVCPSMATGKALHPASCVVDECAVVCATCSDTGDGVEKCSAAGQDCFDVNKDKASLSNWVCICRPPYGPTTAVGEPVATCEPRNECKHPSGAAKQGEHIKRYSNGNCLCKEPWIMSGGPELQGPGAPKTDDNPTGGYCHGCCNPDSDPLGEWCFVDPLAQYNLDKAGCNPDTTDFDNWDSMWGHCAPLGVLPEDGGVPSPIGRVSIPGVPDGESNVCTDVGQKCVDPTPETDGDWHCECVFPMSGAYGPQNITECELNECHEHGATCAAASPPQNCSDLNTTVDSTNDWVCECLVGGPIRTRGQAVDDCQLDECTELCPTCARQADADEHPCTKSGQECVDDTWSTQGDKLGDWRCACAAPLSGQAPKQPATCYLDECVAHCQSCMMKTTNDTDVCADAGQTCEDTDKGTAAIGTWICKCPLPSMSQATLKAVEVCEINECSTASCGANQSCVDDDWRTNSTFKCECTAPFHGQADQASVAACTVDECALHLSECDDGQLCEDLKHDTYGDWVCKCVPPATGVDGQQQKAACTKPNGCEKVLCGLMQVCSNDDPATPPECNCIAPAKGASVSNGTAVCEIDECVDVCPLCHISAVGETGVCDLHNQTCVDEDKSAFNSWKCTCKLPKTGSATAAKASCQLDECTADCATCAKTVCTGEGQRCVDTDPDEHALGSWACKCAEPNDNIATGAVVSDCSYDECKTTANKETCTTATPVQVCSDPDPRVTGDWVCKCVAPASGNKTGAPADACDSWNECLVDAAAASACSGNGQDCNDPDPSKTGDWVCMCPSPGVGFNTGGPVLIADCVLDECTAVCATCADKGSGTNLCEGEGQVCEEGGTNMATKGDWVCACPPPLEFVKASAKVALCSFDECTAPKPGQSQPDGQVCTDAGQECHDQQKEQIGGIVCSCVAPRTGSHTGKPAECSLNECDIHANNKTCHDVGQKCYDATSNITGDWACLCISPQHGSAHGAPATCQTNECDKPENIAACAGSDPPQKCEDNDRDTDGDWVCSCPVPQTAKAGTGGQQAAVCVLDECEATCATCEKNKCGLKGQDCFDPDTRITETRDWVCKCKPPSTDERIGDAVVKCSVDECVAGAAATCAGGAHSQKCVDPDPMVSGDWKCECQSPLAGKASGDVAACTFDECSDTTTAARCADAGQVCIDTDKSPDALGTIECGCVFPSVRVTVGVPSTCSNEGECAKAANEGVCTAAKQSCRDPTPSGPDNDWLCECLPPASAPAGRQTPAACVLDECVSTCATCAGDVCTAGKQECVDVDTRAVASGLSNWECRCQAPEAGAAVGKLAACTEDECLTYESTCRTADQDCVDADKTTQATWKCVCKAPQTGEKTGAAASCVEDECDTDTKAKCEAMGQTCVDTDPTPGATGNWMCKCAPPSTSTTMGGPGPCDVDECTVYGAACEAMGQTCVDGDNTTAGDWACACQPPRQNVTQKGGVAACSHDECTTAPAGGGQSGNDTCSAAGQTCVDEDDSYDGVNNWVCKCDGLSPTFAVGAPATCEDNECAVKANSQNCPAGQVCWDPDFKASDDWMCRCEYPAVGEAKKGPAACTIDECIDVTVCRSVGQECEDADTSAAALNGWVCKCAADSGATGAPMKHAQATCVPPDGSECATEAIRKRCEDAGQYCVDPGLNKPNDWECRCVAPYTAASGSKTVAACSVDECGAATCTTCQNGLCDRHDQACVDPDHTRLSDWKCKCKAPRVGEALQGVAGCALDECVTTCATCADTGNGAGNVCEQAGQLCRESDLDVRATNNWMCVCKAPSTGTATGQAAPCTLNECDGNAVCSNAEQDCHDPDTTPASTGDWSCTCKLPEIGTMTIGAADCQVNECLTSEDAKQCAAAGQRCIDPNPTKDSTGDWECHCSQGSVSAMGKAADCVLDECTEVCDTCADTGSGHTCKVAGQACTDPTSDPSKTRDWKCVCPSGTPFAVAAAAVCALDECRDVSDYGARTCEHVVGGRKTVDGCTCECGWRDAGLAGTGAGRDMPCNSGCCNPNERPSGAWCKIDRTKNQDNPKCTQEWGTCVAADPVPAGEEADNVCTKEGQDCVDVDPTPESRMDWKCLCRTPAAGTVGLQQLATCVTDECSSDCLTCAKDACSSLTPPQVCVDDDAGTGNWKCVCPEGSTGDPVMGGKATCTPTGECGEGGAGATTCAAAGQVCVDDAPSTAGDWVCACLPPTTGVKVEGGAAVCELDECTASCATCAKGLCRYQEQTCEDPSKAPGDTSDWMCKCNLPYSGEAKAAVAVCGLDECLLNGDACPAGQACKDATPATTGDWMCVCNAPATGSQTGGSAACKDAGEELDECDAMCDTCENELCKGGDQECEDVNKSPDSRSDWQCKGKAPCTATAPMALAKCTVSECVEHLITCRREEQACVDPSHDTTGDWYCECAPPATGKQVGGVAACELDECIFHSETCSAQRQTCVDTDRSSQGTWKCLCTGSATGEQVGGPADCKYDEKDECKDSATEKVCSDAGQACADPDAGADNYACQCVAPLSAAPGAGQRPAKCVLDECIARCPTCAQQPGVSPNVCTAAGQLCRDESTDPASKGDWMCECRPPQSGSARGAAATCGIDECADVPANARVCAGAEQQCADPTAAAGDWECRCLPPAVGAPVQRGAAACGIDECVSVGNDACKARGQMCTDPSTQKSDDWVCKCPYSDETKTGGPVATCAPTTGLCAEHGTKCVLAEQLCVEMNNEWYCRCFPPASGEAAGMPVAQCGLDECTAVCGTCAQQPGGHVCTSKGQTCEDTNTGVHSLNDWVCKCPGSGTTAPTQAAACGTDECLDKSKVCTDATDEQECVDTDKNELGNWECRCVLPLSGSQMGAPASCQLDECLEQGSICKGQRCTDENTSPESKGDWYCVCGDGATGREKAGLAVCDYTFGGCTLAVHRATCEAEGQTCVADYDDIASYRCACPPPSMGEPQKAGPATCVLDECTAVCLSCARTSAGAVNPCVAAEQMCVDDDTSPGAVGGWMCKCHVGNQMALRAVVEECSLDECAPGTTGDKTCSAADQVCVDDDTRPEATGTWLCRCRHSAGLEAQGSAVPDCGTNECVMNGHAVTCAKEGQECVDPSPLVDGDWGCGCVGGAEGFGKGGAAACTYPPGDECENEGNRMKCTAEEQACEDPNPAGAGDWVCTCFAPAQGRQPMGPATCGLDECTTPLSQCGWCAGDTCGADQVCKDPTPVKASTQDWTCTCAPPAGGSAKMKRVASCSFDECDGGAAAVCTAGSKCEEGSQDVANDWRCVCDNGVDSARASAAVCGIDECLDEKNLAVCESASPRQMCVDSDRTKDLSWECVCPHGTAKELMAVVPQTDCDYQGECKDQAINEVCKQAGQHCLDSDPATPKTWECVCAPPMVGAHGKLGVAKCGVDECGQNRCMNGVDCPRKVCAGKHQTCVDNDPMSLGSWVCESGPQIEDVGECAPEHCTAGADCPYNTCNDVGQHCRDTDKLSPDTWRCYCTDDANETTFNDLATASCASRNSAAGVDDDDCGGFMSCWWWLLLLLLLCCCCLVVLALFLVRMRQTNADVDEQKWGKHFEAKAQDGAFEEFELDEKGRGGGLSTAGSQRSLMAGQQSDLTQGLLEDSEKVAGDESALDL